MSPITDCIIEMMQYGQALEKKKLIDETRPVLQLVEKIISYYTDKDSGNRSPIISLPRVNNEFEQILVNYLIIRFGLFCRNYYQEILSQYNNRIRNVIPEKGTDAYKEFTTSVDFYNKKGELVRRNKWDYRVGFNMIAYALSNTDNGTNYFDVPDEVNTLICPNNYLPPKKTSLLSKRVHEGFSTNHRFNILSDKADSASVLKYLKAARIDRNSPIRGNFFVLYVNSARYRSFNDMVVLQTFKQVGYDVRNLFIFDISEKGYSLKNLIDERTRLSNIYHGHSNPNDDYFCYSPQDSVSLLSGVNTSSNRENIPCGDDFDVYFPQVTDLLEGFGGRKRVLCNILSLCATEASETHFYEYLNSIDPEFEADGVIEIFDYIRQVWKDTIIPKIYSFIGDATRFSLVVEYTTPDTIKEEIQSLFPDKTVVFRKPSDLSPRHGRIGIEEGKIIVMRYLQCKSYPSNYPNSYDPYIINPDQDLLEIIPEILFKGLNQLSLSNQTRHSNGLLDSSFRRDVLHWEPKQRVSSYTQNRFDIFGDDEYTGDDEGYTSSADKVHIVYGDGADSFPIDTEPVIYHLRDETLAVGTLRDIVDNTEVQSIQFLFDIEKKLSDLLDDRNTMSLSADTGIREELKRRYPDFDFSDGEIWKLALKAKIEKEGFDTVVFELSPKLEEKRLTNRLKDWSNPTSRTMLPRKKRTRKILFDYIDISQFSAYLRSLYSRYLSTIRNSREKNALIDELVKSVIGHTLDESYYQIQKRHIPEALELFGISTLGDYETMKKIIIESIDLKTITSITSNDQY